MAQIEEKKTDWQKILVLVLAVAVFYMFWQMTKAPAQQPAPQIIIQQPQVQPQPQVVVQQPARPVEYVDFAKLVVFAMDEEANPITQGVVELWRVSNESEVLGKGFYATTGYSVWMSANLTDLGYAEFTISRVQWDVIKQLMEKGIKVYAVVIPSGDYYRAGAEVPELSFIKGNETTSLTITVQKIATLLYQYDILVDLRGLSAGTENTWEDTILKVSVNEKGVLKIYKFEVVPSAALTNATAFIDTLQVTIGGETVTLIEGGSVKLTSAQNVTIPLTELKAGETLGIAIYYKLSAAPDAALDNAELFTVKVYDVRDALVGTSRVSIDTA